MKNTKNKNEALPRSIRRGILETASFVCGAMVMVVEMAGSRLLAPWMGSSLIVWTSLIGIILACLSVGYWLGGKLADKTPKISSLSKIILAASISVAILGISANPVLYYVSDAITNLYLSSVVAAITLFSIPSILLGMVSPMIVRIALESNSHIGATVGRFSALSCIGSILGTFLGGFVLISLFSTGTILMLTAAILAVTSGIVGLESVKAKKVKIPVGIIILVIAFIALGAWLEINGAPMATAGIHLETPYNHIRIYEGLRRDDYKHVRVLQTDPVGSQSAMYIDAPNDYVFDYIKFYDLAFYYRPEIKNVLMLGGGGYTVPKNLAAYHPDVFVDVVELDPGMTAAAEKYFKFVKNDKTRIYHEDARTFLNRTSKTSDKYDAIFWDTFNSEYNIPFHLTTVESAKCAYDMLSDDGITIMNIISAADGKSGGVFKGIYAAFTKVFPHIKLFLSTHPNDVITRQNVVLVASKSELSNEGEAEEKIKKLLSNELTKSITQDIGAFTDAFAPVEYYALLMH
ncbi:MAG: fused MFS/spermidine synthase [Synergistaceae bacterium]|nr:fused MFS/spermidine synthase [Synergistaceae bacterium]